MIKTVKDLQILNSARVHFFVIRSLERKEQFVLERMESIKLIRKIISIIEHVIELNENTLSVERNVFPPCMLQSFVSLAENEDDPLRGVCIELTRRLSIIFPAGVAAFDGIFCMLKATVIAELEPLRASILLTTQYLFTKPQWKKYFRLDHDFTWLFACFLDHRSHSGILTISNEDERRMKGKQLLDRIKRHAFVLRYLFHSWTCFFLFASEPIFLESMLKMISVPAYDTCRVHCLTFLFYLLIEENYEFLNNQRSNFRYDNILQQDTTLLKKRHKKLKQVFKGRNRYLNIFNLLNSLPEFSDSDRLDMFLAAGLDENLDRDRDCFKSTLCLALFRLGLLDILVKSCLDDNQVIALASIELFALVLKRVSFDTNQEKIRELLCFNPFLVFLCENRKNRRRTLKVQAHLDAINARIGAKYHSNLEMRKYTFNVKKELSLAVQEQLSNKIYWCGGYCAPVAKVVYKMVDFSVPLLSYDVAKSRTISISGQTEVSSPSLLEHTAETSSKMRKGLFRMMSSLKKSYTAKHVTSKMLRRDSLMEQQRLQGQAGNSSFDLFTYSYRETSGVIEHLKINEDGVAFDEIYQLSAPQTVSSYDALVKLSNVLTTKDWRDWNWLVIHQISYKLLTNVYYLQKLLKTKFFKRIFGVFRLSFDVRTTKTYSENGDYIIASSWSSDNLSYFRVLNQLITILLQNEQGTKFLIQDRRGNLVVQLISLLKRKCSKHSKARFNSFANSAQISRNDGKSVDFEPSIDDFHLFIVTRVGINEYSLNGIFMILFPFTSCTSGIEILSELGFSFVLSKLVQRSDLEFISFEILKNLNYFTSESARNCLFFTITYHSVSFSLKKMCLNLLFCLCFVHPEMLLNLVFQVCQSLVIALNYEDVTPDILQENTQLKNKTIKLLIKLCEIDFVVEELVKTKKLDLITEALSLLKSDISLISIHALWTMQKQLKETTSKKSDDVLKIISSISTLLSRKLKLNLEDTKPKEKYTQAGIPIRPYYLLPKALASYKRIDLYGLFLLPWSVKIWIIRPNGVKQEVENTCYLSLTRSHLSHCVALVAKPVQTNLSVPSDASVYVCCTLGGLVMGVDGEVESSEGSFGNGPKFSGLFPLNVQSNSMPNQGSKATTQGTDYKNKIDINEVDFNVSPHRRLAWTDSRWYKCLPENRTRKLEMLADTDTSRLNKQENFFVRAANNSPVKYHFTVVNVDKSKTQEQQGDLMDNHVINPLFNNSFSDLNAKSQNPDSTVKFDTPEKTGSDSDTESEDELNNIKSSVKDKLLSLEEVSFFFEVQSEIKAMTDVENSRAVSAILQQDKDSISNEVDLGLIDCLYLYSIDKNHSDDSRSCSCSRVTECEMSAIVAFFVKLGSTCSDADGVAISLKKYGTELFKKVAFLAYACPYLNVKGEAFYCINKVAASKAGRLLLKEYDWIFTQAILYPTSIFISKASKTHERELCYPSDIGRFLAPITKQEITKISEIANVPPEGVSCPQIIQTIKTFHMKYHNMEKIEKILNAAIENRILIAISNLSNHITHQEGHKELILLYNTEREKFNSAQLFYVTCQYLCRFKFTFKVRQFIMNLFYRCITFEDFSFWHEFDNIPHDQQYF